MARAAVQQRKLPLPLLIVGAILIAALIGGGVYLNRPVPKTADQPESAEAKAYLANLEISKLDMKASENFMKQQVVEIQGEIRNKGPRALRSIDIYCLFSGVDGREVYREKVPILPARASALAPGQTRAFRLPFDTLPETWNQAVPRMVIAQITFAR